MAITAEKLLKLSQFKAGLQRAKSYTDGEVTKVKDLVGSLPEGTEATTVVEYVNKKTEGIATDAALSELQTQVNTNKTDIATLNGTGTGSVKKSVDDALNEFATKVSNDDVVNTYKELVDWAAEHGPEAAAMAGNITANEEAIKKKANSATTLEGYGISDAYTKTAADAKTKEIIGTEITVTVATDAEVTAACNEVFGAA